MKFTLETAHDGKHKYIGVFTEEDGHTTRVPFGAAGMSDFTKHRNPLRKEAYLRRHRTTEDWSDPKTAGALSRWILWNTQDLHQAVSQFRRKFHLSS